MKKYPKCFPENFETEILPEGAKEENKSVYRIIKKGQIDRDSFISTYEEMQSCYMPAFGFCFFVIRSFGVLNARK